MIDSNKRKNGKDIGIDLATKRKDKRINLKVCSNCGINLIPLDKVWIHPTSDDCIQNDARGLITLSEELTKKWDDEYGEPTFNIGDLILENNSLRNSLKKSISHNTTLYKELHEYNNLDFIGTLKNWYGRQKQDKKRN